MHQPSELDLLVIGTGAVMTGLCLYTFGLDPYSIKGGLRLAGAAILAGATAKFALEYFQARRLMRAIQDR